MKILHFIASEWIDMERLIVDIYSISTGMFSNIWINT